MTSHLTQPSAMLKHTYTRTHAHTHTHTHTHTFNGPLSGTNQVSRYQKGKTSLDFTEARDSEWQWHQLGHMQVCTLLQIDNHASTPPLSFLTGRIPFLPPNQQRHSTEGNPRSSRTCKKCKYDSKVGDYCHTLTNFAVPLQQVCQ